MKLDITSIIKDNGGTININVKEALEVLKAGLGTVSFTSRVSFTGEITNNNGMLKLIGLAKVFYSTVCDRCARNIERELIVDIDEEVIEKEKTSDDTAENYVDDRFTFVGNWLDLGRVLADCILTSVSMTQICRENCLGLCHVCGAEISDKGCNCEDNGPIDSRLEILKEFFD